MGPAFRATFKAEYARFTKLLDDGLGEDGPDPDLARATDLAVGAIMARIYEEVVIGRAADLPGLLPELTYGFLVPFVGEEAARRERAAASSS